MELLYIIYTFNRPRVMQECLRSLMANNDLKPDRLVFIDDGSAEPMKSDLTKEVLKSSSVVDFVSFKENIGYGRVAEIGFAMADIFQPHYCFFIESDYIFRKHGLEEVMDVFQSDVGQHCVGAAGYSGPDFFNPQFIGETYSRDLRDQYGEDNQNRELLFKPFDFKSRFGNIQLQFVSNSCGTMYLNWSMVTAMRREFYPRMETEWRDVVCSRGSPVPVLRDGPMSSGLAYFWMKYAKLKGWDTDKYAALFDIIPSVANHICGGGINAQGRGMEEGKTFVSSPNFPADYNVYPKRG